MHSLTNILSELKLQPLPNFSEKISTYLDLLDRWNRSYNLTAITDRQEQLIKHIADSLAVAPFLNDAQHWIDVGTGAGFPGIPLALLFPERQWTLLDSNVKKTSFLIQVKAMLDLKNVSVVHERVENFRPAQPFDGIICRAWTQLENMIRQTKHLAAENGYLWAMKGTLPTEELAKISEPYKIFSLHVPGLNEQRHLIQIKI